jgi:hypothetical protein
MFDRFRREFPKDIVHLLRLPYVNGNVEEAPSYAVFDPFRVRTELVHLTLGICPSRIDPTKDVVAEFIQALEEEEVCKAAMMSRPCSAQSTFGSDDPQRFFRSGMSSFDCHEKQVGKGESS